MQPYLYTFRIHEFNLKKLAPSMITSKFNRLMRVEVTNTEFRTTGVIVSNTAKFTIVG